MLLATGTHIVITGCDRLMPKNWLKRWAQNLEDYKNIGVISCYTKSIQDVFERCRESKPWKLSAQKMSKEFIASFTHIRAMPLEARIFSRELLLKAGFMREDFGLYGHEDLEWADRVERVTKEFGLMNYILPDMIAEHLGTEGINAWDGKDSEDYHAFKQKECKEPFKEELLQRLREENNPYYNPYT
jgi:GT2 family glycosyltransferase